MGEWTNIDVLVFVILPAIFGVLFTIAINR